MTKSLGKRYVSWQQWGKMKNMLDLEYGIVEDECWLSGRGSFSTQITYLTLSSTLATSRLGLERRKVGIWGKCLGGVTPGSFGHKGAA